MRLVLDFRKLNERTVPERYPMPNISMILGNLGKAKYFTTLDLKSGYHQITLAERDREKTSLTLTEGSMSSEDYRSDSGTLQASSREQLTIFCEGRLASSAMFTLMMSSYFQKMKMPMLST